METDMLKEYTLESGWNSSESTIVSRELTDNTGSKTLQPGDLEKSIKTWRLPGRAGSSINLSLMYFIHLIYFVPKYCICYFNFLSKHAASNHFWFI